MAHSRSPADRPAPGPPAGETPPSHGVAPPPLRRREPPEPQGRARAAAAAQDASMGMVVARRDRCPGAGHSSRGGNAGLSARDSAPVLLREGGGAVVVATAAPA